MKNNQLMRLIHEQLGKPASKANTGEARAGCVFKCCNPHDTPNNDTHMTSEAPVPPEADQMLEDTFALHLCADGHLTATVISECKHLHVAEDKQKRETRGSQKRLREKVFTGNGPVFPDPATNLYMFSYDQDETELAPLPTGQ